MSNNYNEIFKDKTIDELNDLKKQLNEYIKNEKSRLEQQKAREIARSLSIFTPVYFIVGSGKEAKVVEGQVVQLTPTGVTAETKNGHRYTRRYRKLLSPEEAKKRGAKISA